jgi:hypothetical protein
MALSEAMDGWGGTVAENRRVLTLLGCSSTTVSQNFARVLIDDDLQRQYFDDHLQDILSVVGIVGVDNGPFDKVLPAFEPGDPLPQKLARRRVMLERIESWQATEPRVCRHRLTYGYTEMFSTLDWSV